MLNEINEKLGLTTKEAERRLKLYGLNAIEKKKKISKLKIFLAQFNDLIIWILIAATIISGAMGEKWDATTIIVIVIVNAILGFVQEFKTEKSLEALEKLSAPTAKVMRDGVVKVISSECITIGDVIVLEAGDRIPADGELIDAKGIIVDESILTGESVGVEKDIYKNNKVYMGTIVVNGRGEYKVLSIGMETEMGKIANLLQTIKDEKSPLKEKMDGLGKILVFLCLIICAAVTILGIIRGNNPLQMFLLGVSLAVAAIPEGLPAIVTVALALGVGRMLKRNALVKKLPAVETLGCTSVICSDKTGTLTENNMTLKALWLDRHYYNLDKEKNPDNYILKKISAFCNDVNINKEKSSLKDGLVGDPTETALIKAFFNNTREVYDFSKRGKRVYEIGFSSERKMMSVVINIDGREECYVKGAPEKIIERSKFILMNGQVLLFTDNLKREAYKKVEEMSLNALRCMGFAYKLDGLYKNQALEDNLILVGIGGIIDPPRKEAKEAILRCKMAGIKPVMITGDHKNTAYAIGRELGICKKIDEVLTGEEIDKFSDKDFKDVVNKVTVYARVNPSHKLKIVKAFKENGLVVAMTGDGVNDAPAVKESDIGVSMGITGTDVTKEAASMILLDDNYRTIVSAIEEGRIIYSNIRKFIRYLLSCNLGEVLTMFLSSIFNLPTPLLPIQILFVNLATDGLPAMALGVDTEESDMMEEKPREKNESLFSKGLSEKIFIRGTLIGICTLLSFILSAYFKMNLATCRTIALCTLVMSQLIHVFECRSEKKSIFEINMFSNMYLVLAVLTSVLMVMCILYIPVLAKVFHTVPLTLAQWTMVVFFSSIIAFINSIYLYFRHKKRF